MFPVIRGSPDLYGTSLRRIDRNLDLSVTRLISFRNPINDERVTLLSDRGNQKLLGNPEATFMSLKWPNVLYSFGLSKLRDSSRSPLHIILRHNHVIFVKGEGLSITNMTKSARIRIEKVYNL